MTKTTSKNIKSRTWTVSRFLKENAELRQIEVCDCTHISPEKTNYTHFSRANKSLNKGLVMDKKDYHLICFPCATAFLTQRYKKEKILQLNKKEKKKAIKRQNKNSVENEGVFQNKYRRGQRVAVGNLGACHRCKRKHSNDAMFVCTLPEPKKSVKRSDTGPNTNKCKKGFCLRCLFLHHKKIPAPDLKKGWKCPCCLLVCTCGKCRREKASTDDKPRKIHKPAEKPPQAVSSVFGSAVGTVNLLSSPGSNHNTLQPKRKPK
jgi:hypothetical protein